MRDVLSPLFRLTSRCLWRALLWLSLYVVTGLTQAQTLNIDRAYWIDTSETARIEDVHHQIFDAAPNILALGYSSAATWLRLTIPPQYQKHWLLTVRPGHLDSIQLFTPVTPTHSESNGWLLREQGDRFAFVDRERADLTYSFALSLSSSADTVVYLRLQTSSTQALSVQVQSMTELEEQEKRIYLGVGLYSGLGLLLGFFSAFRFVITKDRLWGINGLSQLASVALVLMYLGFWSKYVTPDNPVWGDVGTSVLICVHLFVVLWYYREFGLDFQAPRWLMWGLSLCLLALPLQLWAIAHEHTRWAMQLNANLVLLRTFGGFVVAWLFVIQDPLLRWMVRFAHLSMSVYGLIFILPILGYGEMNEWHLYPPMMITFFSAVMQYLVLNRRDWLANRERFQLRQRIRQAEQELVWEQQRLAQSASFMGMLLHELKNPLASIRLSALNVMEGRSPSSTEQHLRLSRILQSVDGIDAVLERCRQVDQLEQGQWAVVQKQTHDVVALLHVWQMDWPQGHRLHTVMPTHLYADVDAGLLKTMISNLIDNALAYSPPESVVTLTVQKITPQRTPWFVLSVSNDIGKAGVPDAQKVFTKYYRAAAAHQRTGSGLGLFLVKNLAEMADGHLLYRVSSSGQVVFELHLPLHQDN